MATAANTETAILDRLLATTPHELPQDAARFLLGIDFATTDVDRMNDLAARAQSGTLSREESVEIENYRHVSHLLALLHSKARRSMGGAGAT